MSSGIEKFCSRRVKQRILDGDEPPWITANPRAAYVRACYLSTPLWVKSADFRFIRHEALQLTKATGVTHVLDHLVPVTHPYVCGLTVPWNVVAVPRSVNARKSNHWHPDQLQLNLGD